MDKLDRVIYLGRDCYAEWKAVLADERDRRAESPYELYYDDELYGRFSAEALLGGYFMEFMRSHNVTTEYIDEEYVSELRAEAFRKDFENESK